MSSWTVGLVHLASALDDIAGVLAACTLWPHRFSLGYSHETNSRHARAPHKVPAMTARRIPQQAQGFAVALVALVALARRGPRRTMLSRFGGSTLGSGMCDQSSSS